ncbi:YkgJ family cysteine cluster protein [Acinetobacter baumannii]|uniref:Ferredoxin n=1 Tax=Acinetobacter baumannii TaxID=470 RepID=A0A0J8TQQ1_ACIBA|nr:YkgJ family cysteine cluster protein [Acinetobacter baumannii]EKU2423313.1 YkgJ family cysteine cluster protein [Acinetobacter baumannii]EKV1717736.1 YkgJ family cysteine cluster protein [Acinetobacter baumannii]EKX2699700.1 YkgJ family cysteine cluster protein [Acinetobacter baumannii]EKX9478809.1 YkgJ family cysteine cluster protein [Acinetobacter baumannii]EKY1319479.1 YkgJ family cysteine cluster protein [Acinetobacter baumannii]
MLSQVATPDECLRCGACCAHFRVSFYWAEAELMEEHLVEPLTPVYSCMRGTNQPEPRCQALTGEIGKEVGCSIYAVRSSTCRAVQIADEQCNKARLAHQLIPLIQVSPADSENDHDYDQVS